MRPRSGYHFSAITLSLATLLTISGTAEAGISLSNPKVQQTGDPHTEYSFSILLIPGSSTTLPFGTSFTLNNLIGIDFNNPIRSDHGHPDQSDSPF